MDSILQQEIVENLLNYFEQLLSEIAEEVEAALFCGSGVGDDTRDTNPTGQGVRSDSEGGGDFGDARSGDPLGHQGVDYLSTPGQPVRAPVAGEVVRDNLRLGDSGAMGGIIIREPDGTTTRVLYIDPSVGVGDTISEGQVIGTAQDTGAGYNNDAMLPHVHVDMVDSNGNRVDPADTILECDGGAGT